MNASNKTEEFLYIDSLKERMQEYCDLIKNGRESHTVLFHGDTGCGKRRFSEECAKKVLERNKEIIVIDMTGQFVSVKQDSEEKMKAVSEIIEHELVHSHNIRDIAGKHDNIGIFMRVLEKVLAEKNSMLLVRLPIIEVVQELEAYYSCLNNSNTILYFMTENKEVITKCQRDYGLKIVCLECQRLKQGDGELFINSRFQREGEPVFDVADIESLMSKRGQENKMTINELEKICGSAYRYAKKNNIETIDKAVILDDFTSRGLL